MEHKLKDVFIVIINVSSMFVATVFPLCFVMIVNWNCAILYSVLKACDVLVSLLVSGSSTLKG